MPSQRTMSALFGSIRVSILIGRSDKLPYVARHPDISGGRRCCGGIGRLARHRRRTRHCSDARLRARQPEYSPRTHHAYCAGNIHGQHHLHFRLQFPGTSQEGRGQLDNRPEDYSRDSDRHFPWHICRLPSFDKFPEGVLCRFPLLRGHSDAHG